MPSCPRARAAAVSAVIVALGACTAPHPDVSDRPAFGRDIVEVRLVVAADSCVDAATVYDRIFPAVIGPMLPGIEEGRSKGGASSSTFTFYGPDADVMWDSVRAQLVDVVLAAGSTLYLRRGGAGSSGTTSDLTTRGPEVRRCEPAVTSTTTRSRTAPPGGGLPR